MNKTKPIYQSLFRFLDTFAFMLIVNIIGLLTSLFFKIQDGELFYFALIFIISIILSLYLIIYKVYIYSDFIEIIYLLKAKKKIEITKINKVKYVADVKGRYGMAFSIKTHYGNYKFECMNGKRAKEILELFQSKDISTEIYPKDALDYD